jgi:DNA repair protein RecO (recombination protein O)
MSYNIYTTKGLVLSGRPIKEADKLYSILTRDLGMIRARALGVRKEASKLRSGLSDITLSHVSLVKGQANWRLTSATEYISASDIRQSKKVYKMLYRVASLLEKLVQGEERHRELFDAVEEAFLFAIDGDVSEDRSEALEMVIVSRILYYLGYLGEKDVPQGMLADPLSVEIIERASMDRKNLIRVINSGIHTTGLV